MTKTRLTLQSPTLTTIAIGSVPTIASVNALWDSASVWPCSSGNPDALVE